MVVWHAHRKKKASGGLYRANRDKKKYELGMPPAMTKVSERKKVIEIRTRSGHKKMRALEMDTVNVLDPKTGKHQKAKIKKILESTASRHFARMGVMTKGALIETDKGKAKITNRPGQEGFVNAVLVS
jgi:small subunit ribosomal protein S8e